MIPATTFSGKRVALFGLGGSGIATARSLVEGGAEVLAFDDNPQSVAKAVAEGIPTADLRDIDWSRVSSLVLSPGVPLTHPKPHWSVELARGAGVEVIGDVELFCRERVAHAPQAPLVAITGTNGKSTTTALTAHILKSAGRDAQMGGNIGRAVMTLDPLQAARPYVVECSSYQIDLAPSINPTAGVLLNLTPDHLDRHGTMQHYASIKERLVAGAETAIIGIDDSWCAQIADRLERVGKEVIRISKRLPLTDGYFADGTDLMEAVDGRYSRIAFLEGIGSLRGQHNAQNALDWNGTYEATLPCADCPGIKTILTLNSDQTFQISQQYLKNHTEETTTEDTGMFEWQKNGSIIHLKGKETDMLLQVGENRLMALDKRGEDMGSQKDHYIFTKKY